MNYKSLQTRSWGIFITLTQGIFAERIQRKKETPDYRVDLILLPYVEDPVVAHHWPHMQHGCREAGAFILYPRTHHSKEALRRDCLSHICGCIQGTGEKSPCPILKWLAEIALPRAGHPQHLARIAFISSLYSTSAHTASITLYHNYTEVSLHLTYLYMVIAPNLKSNCARIITPFQQTLTTCRSNRISTKCTNALKGSQRQRFF